MNTFEPHIPFKCQDRSNSPQNCPNHSTPLSHRYNTANIFQHITLIHSIYNSTNASLSDYPPHTPKTLISSRGAVKCPLPPHEVLPPMRSNASSQSHHPSPCPLKSPSPRSQSNPSPPPLLCLSLYLSLPGKNNREVSTRG